MGTVCVLKTANVEVEAPGARAGMGNTWRSSGQSSGLSPD
jgi:hypothetical protein